MNKKTLIFFLGCTLFACSSINEKVGLKDDNFVEEAVEVIIEEKTGIEMDLTPSTPESNTPLKEIIHSLEDRMNGKESLQGNDKRNPGYPRALVEPKNFRT